MIYKNERNVKLLVLDSDKMFNAIYDEDNLLETIKNNLNSVDYDLLQEKKVEINIIEFNIINDNNLQTYSNSVGKMKYNKIYQIYYSLIEKKDRKEI